MRSKVVLLLLLFGVGCCLKVRAFMFSPRLHVQQRLAVSPNSRRVLHAEGEKSSASERKGGKKSRRVRKRREAEPRTDDVEAVAPASSASEIQPQEVDPKVRARQEAVIKREVDRDLRLEEFADGTAPASDDDDEEPGAGLKFDPTFELPIPSETMLSLSDMGVGMDGPLDKDQKLPSLAELGKKAKGAVSVLKKQAEQEEKKKVELEPIDNYDLSSGILGEGRPVMGIGLPYLQSCHTMWLLTALLCAFVEYPGFPLTNLPFEIREFLKQGLVVTYAINAVLAFDSIGAASKRGQNVPFWVVKCFALGGLAHNELLLIREKGTRSSEI